MVPSNSTSRAANSNEIEKGSIDEMIYTDFQFAKGSRVHNEADVLMEME